MTLNPAGNFRFGEERMTIQLILCRIDIDRCISEIYFFLTSSVYMMLYILTQPAVNENVKLFSLFIGNVLVKYGREWFGLHKKKRLHCVKNVEQEVSCQRIALKWIIHDLALTVIRSVGDAAG